MQNTQQRPSLRTISAAVVAFIAIVLVTFGATIAGNKYLGNPLGQTKTVTATKTVPAPSPSSAQPTGIVLDPSSPLSKAETNFQKVSIATGLKITEDAANPQSLTEAYDGINVGNKRLELARGLDKKAGFPEIFLDYDKQSRQVIMWSITSTNPTARLSKEQFDGITLTFQSLDPAPNNLERKLKLGRQLTADDYIAFMRAGNLGMRAVRVTHGNAQESTVTLHGMVYQYHAATATDSVPITAGNYGIMDRMGRDLELTEIELRHGL